MESSNPVLELKESVESQVRLLQIPTAREDVRRDCAAQILETVVSFLTSWRNKDASTDFPSGIVRDAFSVLFSEVGPGDAHVRIRLLETLASLSTNECRQAILDVMPCIMPVDDELEEATKQVLDALRTVLMVDADTLLPVLGCLSLLPLSEKGRAEAWNVALASLPVVSEADLPVLARTLLCHVTNKEDALRALVALRSEFELLQSTDNEGDDDPIPLIIHVLLGALNDGESGSMLAKAYLDILRSMPTDATFLVLDVVAVLALYQNPQFQSDMSAIMDSWIKSNSFPFETFHLLLKIIRHRHRPGEAASVLYDFVVPSLLTLGTFLLLAPVRIDTTKVRCASTHQLMIELHHGIDRDYQEELVRCLFHLSEETSWSPEESNKNAARSLVRSRRLMETASKRKGLLITADAVHVLLQDLASTAKSSVARFKHVLLQRLTSIPNDSAIDDLSSTKQLCAILTRLVEPTVSEGGGGGGGIDASEVMILLQKLLFTASYCADRRSPNGESMGDVGRVVRGLVLATELIQSESMSNGDKECIHQWVHRILLPSTRRTIDPEIGCQGLQFLPAWSAWHEGLPGRALNADQNMFQDFKMILANTGLVQMLTTYLERRKRPNEVVLGYASIPSQFLSKSGSAKNRNKRDMIFCVNSFLRTNKVHHPARWAQMSNWVFDLVNIYLTMGREGTKGVGSKAARSKWLPDGWLEASIELPALNLTFENASKKTEKCAKFLTDIFCRYEIASESTSIVPKSAYGDLVNALIGDKSLDQIVGDVESLLRLSLAFLLGISLSAAVLRNTYAHSLSLDSTADERSADRRRGMVKLMQYQLMKIYDLREKSESSISFLRAFAATLTKAYLRRPGRRKGGVPIDESDDIDVTLDQERSGVDIDPDFRKASNTVVSIEVAAEQIERTLSQIFDTEAFVDPRIIMKCLVDKDDDAVVIEGLSASAKYATLAGFSMTVNLRRSLLDHISSVYQTICVHVENTDRTFAEAVIQMASDISRLLPTFRKKADLPRDTMKEGDGGADARVAEWDDMGTDDVTALLSSYFRFIKCILTKAAEKGYFEKEKAPRGITTSTPDTSNLMTSFLSSAIEISSNSQAFTDSTARRARPSDIAHAFCAFIGHLHMCEDEATALELIDILSILSSDDADLVAATQEATWRVLHTVYIAPRQGLENSSDALPFAFLDMAARVRERCNGLDARENKYRIVERALSATIMRSATNASKCFQKNSMLRRTLLVMLGLMARPCSCFEVECDYMGKLIDELVRFLDGVDDGSASPMEIEDKAEESGDESGPGKRRRSRSRRNRVYASSIPSLKASSFDAFFEITLHVAVALFAASAQVTQKLTTSDTQNTKSPFHQLHMKIKLIGRLLDIYVSRSGFFAQRMVSVALGACKQMLSVCLYHVHGCVRWRNSQPLLSAEQKRAGAHDVAAIGYLQELLDIFASFGPSKVMSMCQIIRSQSVSSNGTDDEEESEALLVMSNDKRFTSLMLSAQQTMETLRNVASSHNLVPPQFEDVFAKITSPTTKIRPIDITDKGYHQLEGLGPSEKVDDEAESIRKKRRRVTPTSLPVHDNASDENNSAPRKRRHTVIGDDEYEWVDGKMSTGSNDEGAASMEGFGVSGRWGDDDDDDIEESGSESLELQVSDIFQAA